MEVGALEKAANNNAQTIWQGCVGSIGVGEHGEFYMVILSIPGRSYRLLFSNTKYLISKLYQDMNNIKIFTNNL